MGLQSRRLFQLGQLQKMGSGITETCFGHFHRGMRPLQAHTAIREMKAD